LLCGGGVRRRGRVEGREEERDTGQCRHPTHDENAVDEELIGISTELQKEGNESTHNAAPPYSRNEGGAHIIVVLAHGGVIEGHEVGGVDMLAAHNQEHNASDEPIQGIVPTEEGPPADSLLPRHSVLLHGEASLANLLLYH